MVLGVHTVEIVNGNRTKQCNLVIDSSGLTFSKFKPFAVYSWNNVKSVTIEGPDAVQKRITASRLLLMGPFALAAKKKTGEAFVFLALKGGSEVIFKFPKKSEPEVKAIFAPFRKLITELESLTNEGDESAPKEDIVEKIKKLAELRDQGLISDDEFATKKTDLLNRM
jgi:hypothetical protein